MNRCIRCVLPDTRPDTEFVNGVCAACLAYEQRPTIDWGARLEQLKDLLKRHGNRCIVPSSGGKDSHYQVITLKRLGAHVTAVTAMTCHPTQMGIVNIQNLARFADETVIYYPNIEVRKKLNRLGLAMVGDISWPEHVSIFTTPWRAAVELEIDLMFYGENPQNQYGGPLDSMDALTMGQRWVSEFGGFLGLRPSDLVGQEGLTAEDMEPYHPPRPTDVANVEAHFLGQYIPWDSRRNADIAYANGMAKRLPTLANRWDAENLDNAQTGLHDYFMFLKYGFGRGCSQIAVDVRQGICTRDEALAWVRQHDGAPPHHYMGHPLDQVLERIGLTMTDLKLAITAFTNWDLFTPGSPWPRLKEWTA